MEKVKIEIERSALKGLDGFGIKYSLVSDASPAVIASEFNPADFILLEGKDGKEGHPDLLVSKYRLQASPFVKSAGKNAGLNVQDTAQEKNGRMYAGNINHEQALRLNLLLGGRTLNAGTARELFSVLLSRGAFDGNGKKIRGSELNGILDEIAGVRAPYRAEWYEDSFDGQDKGISLRRNYVLSNGVLAPEYTAPLQPCLMENRTPGISFRNWAKNANSQGWPKENVKGGELFYWSPTAGRVAGFYAFSDRAYLIGYWYPLIAYSGLGVRHVREAPK